MWWELSGEAAMQEFSVFAIVFLILALVGGFGEIPEDPGAPDEALGLLTLMRAP